MVLKLYGYPMSTATRRVATVLIEKAVPFEFIRVELPKGEHKAPSYLEKQPFGQVPYIDDDGFVLFESRAIARYIAEKYADQGTPNLAPGRDSTVEERAVFEQAASSELSNFEPFAAGAFREVFLNKLQGKEHNPEVVKGFLNTLAGKLDGYERILSKQKYIAGDHLTLVDLYHLPFGAGLPLTGNDMLASEERPHVARWWKELINRPSWVQVKDGVSSGTA